MLKERNPLLRKVQLFLDMGIIFHSLKVELTHRERYDTRTQARASVFEYIEGYYNRHRRHSAIGYQQPMAYEAAHAA